MESMKARLLTAAIGVPLAVGLFILGEHFHWVMYILVSLLSIIMIFELLSAAKLHNNIFIFIPCMLYGIIQPMLVPFKLGFFTLYAFVLAMFIIMIKNNKSISYPKLCYALIGTVIIVFGLSSILLLPPMYDNYFTFFFVFCIGVPWCADAGAYFTGVFFGKHKLSPVISPNKTVEGFIGGLAAGTISSVLIPVIYTFLYPNPRFDYLLLVLVGLLCSIVSVAGDLSFSLIKRSCKIKDYGSIFPGHGGFLDRFDSVIFAAPIVYFMGKYFVLFSI